jgi:hypothetical protein
MSQVLLIGGAPRSGTTFIASTLNAHPRICLFSEFSLTNIFRSLDKMIGPVNSAKLSTGDISPSDDFSRPSSEHYDSLFRSVFQNVYPHKTPSIPGGKMPALATKEDVDYLLSRNSKLKVIYILRNCMATVASSMRRYEATLRGKDNWLYESPSQALYEWIYNLLIGQYLAQRADTLFIKYEDFVKNPNEFLKVSEFLGTDKIRFDVSPANHPLKSLDELAIYPDELSELVHKWDFLSAEEIAGLPLHAVRNHVAASWQHMSIALCDIRTHINSNRPEPWGAWSRPGFFALKPRFIRTDRLLRYVDLEIPEKLERVAQANIRTFIGKKATSSSFVETSENVTHVRITSPALKWLGNDRPVISIFFDRWIVSERDPRPLGLPVKRYRLHWDEGATEAMSSG